MSCTDRLEAGGRDERSSASLKLRRTTREGRPSSQAPALSSVVGVGTVSVGAVRSWL